MTAVDHSAPAPATSVYPMCHVAYAGCVAYDRAWEWQTRLSRQRGADEVGDTLLLLEHPHTYTLGSSGHDEHVLLHAAELTARGIAVHRVDRGGDVTYHGPGQLVGYPILKLDAGDNLHTDVIGYVRRLETVVIRSLACFGIDGWRLPGFTGVWVGATASPAKICAIGVKVTTRRVTFHGFALNVNTDLSYFSGIVPCGIRDKGVTSMRQLLRRDVPLNEVIAVVTDMFGQVFARRMVHINVSDRPEKSGEGVAP